MNTIPLFPLATTLFPAGVLTLRIFEVRYLDMIKKCIADGSQFGVVTLLSGSEVRSPEGNEQLATIGTMARIEEWSAPMPALLHVRCTGTSRFHLASAEQGKYGLWSGVAVPIDDDPEVPIPPKLQSPANALGALIASLQKDGVPADQMPLAAPFRLDESAWVANRWSELLPLPVEEKLRLLMLQDPILRLQAIRQLLDDRDLLS
ncbi:peptidase S16 [Candidimonas sp. SYP-B2681]|uniref:LON peptidase substrate-binding domain-containing protein n=1 Tax=Candidimonas sp. SYP-B2681 TaxID=2497686 RepID=UPI000F878FE6|nr:LON peptidase substrate-binding domain-containing protein [Candidimonas sp. SYP-B2681]RTZ44648.1 peptidase S16 [Candidimonas sp. SYP-B2681]